MVLPYSLIPKGVKIFSYSSAEPIVARYLAWLSSAGDGRSLEGKQRWNSSMEALALITF